MREISRFWHIANDISKLQDQTEEILMDILSEHESLPDEVILVVSNVRANAFEILNIVGPFLSAKLATDLKIAISQVYNNAQAFVNLMDVYLS